MATFELSCRPVIFESEQADWSYWGKGSSVLIASPKSHYWLTADHVMKNLGGDVESLRIFPSDYSRMSLPFDEKYAINRDIAGDADYADLYMLRIDLSDFRSSGDAPLVSQDIEIGAFPAEELGAGDELWVIGYPAEHVNFNYDECKFGMTRSVIRGVYHGLDSEEHCHTLTVDTTIKIDDYDGLSGGGVFWLREQTFAGKAVVTPLLVGLMIRGSVESNIIRFISANVIRNFVRRIEDT